MKSKKEKPLFQQISEKMEKDKDVISFWGPKPPKPKEFWSITQQKFIKFKKT